MSLFLFICLLKLVLFIEVVTIAKLLFAANLLIFLKIGFWTGRSPFMKPYLLLKFLIWVLLPLSDKIKQVIDNGALFADVIVATFWVPSKEKLIFCRLLDFPHGIFIIMIVDELILYWIIQQL